jgi:hypothetical protein
MSDDQRFIKQLQKYFPIKRGFASGDRLYFVYVDEGHEQRKSFPKPEFTGPGEHAFDNVVAFFIITFGVPSDDGGRHE